DVHDRRLSRARRAARQPRVLRRPGQACLPLRLRARPGDPASGAVPPAGRALRELRQRARLHASRPLPRRRRPPLLRPRVRMTPDSEPADAADGRRLLDHWLAKGTIPGAADVIPLAPRTPAALKQTLLASARQRGAAALPLLAAFADHTTRALRRPARRVIYRLAQRGVTIAPTAPPARPLVSHGEARPVRAWLSGIDGTGSRASWILFEGAFGAPRLCPLILKDEIGILDAAGGDITKKRLERELAELAASQKLPWVETDPGRVSGLVAEALARHRDADTVPPAAFERWRSLFDHVPAAEP